MPPKFIRLLSSSCMSVILILILALILIPWRNIIMIPWEKISRQESTKKKMCASLSFKSCKSWSEECICLLHRSQDVIRWWKECKQIVRRTNNHSHAISNKIPTTVCLGSLVSLQQQHKQQHKLQTQTANTNREVDERKCIKWIQSWEYYESCLSMHETGDPKTNARQNASKLIEQKLLMSDILTLAFQSQILAVSGMRCLFVVVLIVDSRGLSFLTL